MKQLLCGLLVVVFVAGMLTCTKLPDASLFPAVKFKPTITAPLQQMIVVTEGRDTTIGISVKGTAPFSYAWYKNNVPLNGFDSVSLALRNIQLSQAGAYAVIVANGYGQDTSVTTLVVDSMFDTIAVSFAGKGTVSPNGNVRVRLEATPVFSYTPNTGTYVDSVIVNGVNLPTITNTSQYTFSPITANGSLRVVFAGINCTLSVSPPVNGAITPALQAKTKFSYGDTITLTAVPDKGYYFGGWGGDTSGTSAKLHLTMKSNKTISATFADTSKLSLTVSSTNGAVTLDPPGGTYVAGAAVKLTAAPNLGYVFSSWKDSAVGAKDTITIVMNSKKTVTAVFSPISYVLSLSASAGGSITTPAALTSTVQYGAATTITAVAQSGCTFTHWEVDSGTAAFADSTKQSTSVTLTKGNARIKAVFTSNGYTLTIASDSGLVSVSPPGKTAFQNGDTAWLTETPATGFRFSGWSGDTVIADTLQTSIKITFVKNRSIIANFTKKGNLAIIVSAVGGSVTKNPDSSSYSYNQKVVLTAVPDSVHAFDHWTGDTTGAETPCTMTVIGNKAITANFVQIYTIAFNGNGSDSGSVPVNTKKYKSGDTVTVSGQGTLKKTGYTFTGWTIASDGSGKLYASGATLTMGTANVTLYAKWTVNLYTITFIKNDSAAIGTMSPQSIASGSSANLIANGFTKAGWSFTGWATTSTGAVVYTDSASYAMGTANVTLYAKWTANTYTITFYPNDAAATGTMSTQSIASGSSANLNTNGFSKTGWSFTGWATTSTGAAAYANGASFTMGTANVTLYAKWMANTYTITFYPNDAAASGTMLPQSMASGSSANLNTNGFSKTGWSFAGWATTSTGVAAYANGVSFTMGSSNDTLYAKWAINQYYVIYFGNNQTDGSTPVTLTLNYQSTFIIAPQGTLVKSGYQFAGWNTKANGSGTSYAPGALDTIGLANDSLYAKWTPNTCTVSFNSNGGSVVTAQTVAYNSAATLPAPAPTKSGYSFAGWYSDTAFSVNFNFSTLITASITLYAKWVGISTALVDDCENDTSINKLGYSWYMYDDSKDGGNSTLSNGTLYIGKSGGRYILAPTAGAGYLGAGYVFPYTLGPQYCTAGPFNYAGIGTWLCDSNSTVDLSGAKSVSFYIKSYNATVVDFLVLTKEVTDFAYYHQLVSTTTSWTKVTVLLSTGVLGGLTQPTWTTRPVALNLKSVQKLEWQMHSDNVGANKTGTIVLDNIWIVGP